MPAQFPKWMWGEGAVKASNSSSNYTYPLQQALYTQQASAGELRAIKEEQFARSRRAIQPPPEPTLVDWLRGRVDEICEASGI